VALRILTWSRVAGTLAVRAEAFHPKGGSPLDFREELLVADFVEVKRVAQGEGSSVHMAGVSVVALATRKFMTHANSRPSVAMCPMKALWPALSSA